MARDKNESKRKTITCQTTGLAHYDKMRHELETCANTDEDAALIEFVREAIS